MMMMMPTEKIAAYCAFLFIFPVTLFPVSATSIDVSSSWYPYNNNNQPNLEQQQTNDSPSPGLMNPLLSSALHPHSKSNQHKDKTRWLFFVSVDILALHGDDDTKNTSNSSNNNQSMMQLSAAVEEKEERPTPNVWEFSSQMIITPDQCDTIFNLVGMFDEALQHANPDVLNVSSTAFRLGNSECIDGVCQCNDKNEEHQQQQQNRSRRVLISHALLEVKTRSSSSSLKPPLQFPTRTASSSSALKKRPKSSPSLSS